VLEALNGVVGKDDQAAARWEPHITPPLLQIWAHNFSDPLIALDAVDIFNSLASVPAALLSLQVLPPPASSQFLIQADCWTHLFHETSHSLHHTAG